MLEKIQHDAGYQCAAYDLHILPYFFLLKTSARVQQPDMRGAQSP